MSSLTIFLSRLIGLFLLFVSLSMYTQKEAIIEIAKAITQNQPLLFATALISLAIGLAIVISHNVWKGGLQPILITLIGWIILIRGLICLFVPLSTISSLVDKMALEQNLPLYAFAPFVIGIYLTNSGFKISSKKK